MGLFGRGNSGSGSSSRGKSSKSGGSGGSKRSGASGRSVTFDPRIKKSSSFMTRRPAHLEHEGVIEKLREFEHALLNNKMKAADFEVEVVKLYNDHPIVAEESKFRYAMACAQIACWINVDYRHLKKSSGQSDHESSLYLFFSVIGSLTFDDVFYQSATNRINQLNNASVLLALFSTGVSAEQFNSSKLSSSLMDSLKKNDSDEFYRLLTEAAPNIMLNYDLWEVCKMLEKCKLEIPRSKKITMSDYFKQITDWLLENMNAESSDVIEQAAGVITDIKFSLDSKNIAFAGEMETLSRRLRVACREFAELSRPVM